jgi:hypothetical protein
MEWRAFLLERPIGVIATISPDGLPHAVPVEVFVWEDKVYCWSQATSVKARNVAHSGVAALTAYKSHARVIVRGPARLLGPDDPDYSQITRGFLDKYHREETYGNDCLIEITPAKIVAG